MIDHQQPPESGHQKGTESAKSGQLERIQAIVEAMHRDRVEPLSTAYAGLVLEGTNANSWLTIIESDKDLIERYVNGLPIEDPTDTTSPGEIRRLMETYGIQPSWSSRELHEAKIETTYLVENCLVAGQHCVIAGPSKSMKTSLAIDLALSLARPCKFLDQFWVPKVVNVLFLSAESGNGTIQETARRVAKSKGFSLAEVEQRVSWGFWVPRAKNSEMLRILDHELAISKATVLIADPMYLMLDGESQANLSANGEQIQAIVDCCKRRGVTAILIDHTKRGSENAKKRRPLQLDDVSGAGKAENFRQWMLIGRRKDFDPNDPIHQLWLTMGGSAGHSGLYQVDIDERRDEQSGSRSWDVSVDRGYQKPSGKKPKTDPVTSSEQLVESARLEENPFV